MTRMEILKKYPPRQCPRCRSCETTPRTDSPSGYYCFGCGNLWENEPPQEKE